MIRGEMVGAAPTAARWRFDPRAMWRELRPPLLFAGTLILALLTHAINMFNFPYYENDEGIYMAQAWSVMTNQGLAPYTYWYDHPPGGWIQIAAWMALAGGPLAFGPAVASGRVLMLLFHLGSSALLYLIGRRIGGSALTGVLAVLLFSFSPLGVYFQRRVLLDNLMTFWVLASIWLILCRYRGALGPIVLSGVAFGVALLSKEIGIIFLPALVYLLWTRVDPRHRVLGGLAWFTVVFAIGSGWFVYATLKGELFPFGSALGGVREHVSLLGTLAYQASRGSGEGLFSWENDFWKTMRLYWLPRDAFIMIAGMAATALVTLLSPRRPMLWNAALPALCILAFLMRGALVIEYYIIPAIPFLALTIAVAATWLVQTYRALLTRHLWPSVPAPARVAEGALALALAVGAGGALQRSPVVHDIYATDQVSSQFQAVEWVKANVPTDAFIVTDHYGLLELWLAGYTYAHSHWKVDRDEMITERILGGDWKNVDYLLVTPQLANDMDIAGLAIVKEAFNHSSLSQALDNPGGWSVAVRKVDTLAVTAIAVPERTPGADGSLSVVARFDVAAVKPVADRANLVVEVRSPAGEIVAKAVIDEVAFVQGETRRFSVPLTLPAGADAASAVLIVGGFHSDWQGTYMWRQYGGMLAP